MRRSFLLLLVLATGCAAGIQQSMVLPWVRGNWAFSGTDFTARDAGGNRMPIHVGADSGTVADIGTVTQILLALDLPFMRMSMAPALLGNNNIEFIQADFLYKHLIVDEPGRRWWLLGGLGTVILNSGVHLTARPSANTSLNGRNITPDDTIDYTSRRDASGGYLALGAQTEITGWFHLFVEALVRFSHDEHQTEAITLNGGANGPSINLSSPPAGIAVDRALQGTVRSDYTVPAVMLSIGAQFNLPSYRVTRRVVSWHAGDPANDEPRPEPEPLPEPMPEPEPLPNDVSPFSLPQPVTPTP